MLVIHDKIKDSRTLDQERGVVENMTDILGGVGCVAVSPYTSSLTKLKKIIFIELGNFCVKLNITRNQGESQ